MMQLRLLCTPDLTSPGFNFSEEAVHLSVLPCAGCSVVVSFVFVVETNVFAEQPLVAVKQSCMLSAAASHLVAFLCI